MSNQASLYDSRSDPFSLSFNLLISLIALWWLLISCLLTQFKVHPFGHLKLPSVWLLCMNTTSKWNLNVTSELDSGSVPLQIHYVTITNVEPSPDKIGSSNAEDMIWCINLVTSAVLTVGLATQSREFPRSVFVTVCRAWCCTWKSYHIWE